jgi:hypothetical protein
VGAWRRTRGCRGRRWNWLGFLRRRPRLSFLRLLAGILFFIFEVFDFWDLNLRDFTAWSFNFRLQHFRFFPECVFDFFLFLCFVDLLLLLDNASNFAGEIN